MPKFFVKTKQVQDKEINIVGKDVNHIKNVLRQKVGDELIICNIENMQDYKCEITKLEEEKIICKIEELLEQNSESNIKITVFQGLPKADKMELIIQKSVELGVTDIYPVAMKRCVVKLNEKDKIKKVDRWQKISEVAAKQCGRNYIPKINNVINFNEITKKINEYDIILIAYEKEEKNKLKQELEQLKNQNKKELKIGIVIGPEGGIEESEVKLMQENSAKIITLGKRILRTETVALNMISIIMYELEN